MNLADYLKALRKSRGLLQKQLAARLKVTPSYLSNLESGRRAYLGEGMVARYKEALSLTDEELDRIEALSQVSTGKMAIPTFVTEEEMEVFRLMASCVGRMPPGQFQTIKRYLESWMLIAGMELNSAGHKGRRIM